MSGSARLAVLREMQATPSPSVIRFVGDVLHKTLSELELECNRLGGVPQDFLGAFFDLAEHPREFIHTRNERRAAGGAVETWVFLEPNQRLLGLLAALRALDGEHVV